MYCFNREGVCIGDYSKAHLFQLMNEHHYLTVGQKKGHVQIDQTACAGFICYDIRFPEWIRTHTSEGAEVIFVVAEWPLVRVDHWRILLQSRAIENQCYVVACNRSGDDPNHTFAGHSMIIDPLGTIIAEAGKSSTHLFADLNLEIIKVARKNIPVFHDRRPELYE